MRLPQLLVPLLAARAVALESLHGAHLDITVIHAKGAADMGIDDGSQLLPPEQWTGFLIDMLEWIAARADFTYTLTTPSGLGPDCITTDASAGIIQYATQYNCGVNDVVHLNRTQIYFGMYYITAPRIQTNEFTFAFLSDAGLSLVMPESELFVSRSFWSSASVLVKPFSASVWIACVLVLFFVTIAMWAFEHAGPTGYTKLLSSSEALFQRSHSNQVMRVLRAPAPR